MTKKIVSILTCIMLISIAIRTFAATESELNNEINELQNSIDDAESQVSEIEAEVDSVMEEIDALNLEIYALEDEITTLNNEIEDLNAEIEELEAELEVQEEKYNEQYETLCTRIVAQYKSGNTTFLELLLNSSSLSDFLSKYYIVGKIAEYDTKLLEQIEEQKTAIENSKAELEEKQSELTEKQAELKMQELSLNNKKINKNKYVSQLTDEQKALQEQIDEENELLQEKQNELAEIARKNAIAATSSGYVYTGGTLTWPCPGYTRISSTFGYRSSPGGYGSSYHKGIDMAAAKGTAILAAETGTVISVSNYCTHNYSGSCGCGGGYGNYLMISHGNGLVTLYAHCSTISVSVGDEVTAGQQIATVGSTGNSTGYHLHFGVLVNGTYVDPSSYLGM